MPNTSDWVCDNNHHQMGSLTTIIIRSNHLIAGLYGAHAAAVTHHLEPHAEHLGPVRLRLPRLLLLMLLQGRSKEPAFLCV